MAMDTPAKIGILGAGPIGLESALYARFLGYDVEIFERGAVAENVASWGHIAMFTPFEMNSSSLGVAALCAQNEDYQPPRDDAILTGADWIEQYLTPLSQTDLLADHLHTRCEVLSVGRRNYLKTQSPGGEARGDDGFRVLYRDAEGVEHQAIADIIIDTTGVFGEPNWMGPGGTAALGERELRGVIDYGPPDVGGAERSRFAGKRTLLVGSGYSAATTVVALANLAEAEASTSVVWLVREASQEGPIPRFAQDPLPARDELAKSANAIAQQAGAITFQCGCVIEQIAREGDRFVVHWRRGEQETEEAASAELERSEFDNVVANVGFQGDPSITSELQVHRCYATDGPVKLAAALMQHESQDCLQQKANGVEALINPEPHFYILGAKSYGRNSQFLLKNGLQQIRDLFALIGERSTLDLYASSKKLNS